MRCRQLTVDTEFRSNNRVRKIVTIDREVKCLERSIDRSREYLSITRDARGMTVRGKFHRIMERFSLLNC